MRAAAAALFTVVSIVPLAAQALPAGVDKVTSVEGITEYRLKNGLRVLLFPDQTKTNVTVNITYLVGSRYEDYGETGMAHLLEHLMFKGSTNHPNVPKELQDHGARPNGTTSVRPHQLLRDLYRDRRKPELGAEPGSRPDGEFLHRQEGSATAK